MHPTHPPRTPRHWLPLTTPPHLSRLVSAHYEGEPRGEGCMLLGSLCAGTPDPGEQGVSPALADCLVSYELLLLQRKQQSQLLLNATFHEARIYICVCMCVCILWYVHCMCTACAPHH